MLFDFIIGIADKDFRIRFWTRNFGIKPLLEIQEPTLSGETNEIFNVSGKSKGERNKYGAPSSSENGVRNGLDLLPIQEKGNRAAASPQVILLWMHFPFL